MADSRDLAGLGGAQLAVAYTLNWVENMTQGRGYVAVALVIFASWSPFMAVAGSYLFGGAQSLQLALQAQGLDDVLMVVGGIVPVESRKELEALGIRGVFGPGSSLTEIIDYIHKNLPKERAL